MENTNIEHRLTEVEQRSKSNTHRLEVMANEQKHQTQTITDVKTDVGRLEGKVDVLESKPAKRWDSLVDKLIWGVAGAVLAFLLARFGL